MSVVILARNDGIRAFARLVPYWCVRRLRPAMRIVNRRFDEKSPQEWADHDDLTALWAWAMNSIYKAEADEESGFDRAELMSIAAHLASLGNPGETKELLERSRDDNDIVVKSGAADALKILSRNERP